jgi:hypothetical protein
MTLRDSLDEIGDNCRPNEALTQMTRTMMMATPQTLMMDEEEMGLKSIQ